MAYSTREKRIAADKKFRENNPNYAKEWQEKNREKILEWRKQNPKYSSDALKRFKKNNPSAFKISLIRSKNIGQIHSASCVYRAVKNGTLVSLKTNNIKCKLCDNRATEYEHRDYNKPLDVYPVCHTCNLNMGRAKYRENHNG